MACSWGADGGAANAPPADVVGQLAPQCFYRLGASPALPCPPGTYSIGPGSITALCSGLCQAGYHWTGPHATSQCAGLCPSGFYCPEGVAAPIPCPAGRFSAATGLGVGFGYGQTGNTALLCSACPAGQYAPGPGSSACLVHRHLKCAPPFCLCRQNCALGAAQPAGGQLNCSQCGPGRFAGFQGQAICSDCPAGLAFMLCGS